MHKFTFDLGQTVKLISNEKGRVVGRAHYLDSQPTYLIRYVAATGEATEAWWNESALQAD